MISKPSLLKRLLLGQLSILIFFASFAAFNFSWNFYREAGNLERALLSFAKPIGPLVERYYSADQKNTILKELVDSYGALLANEISLAKLELPAEQTGLKVIISIRDANGRELLRNNDTGSFGQIPALALGLHEVEIDKIRWQMVSTLSPSGKYIIQFGEPSSTTYEAVRNTIVAYIVYPLAVFLPIAAVLMGLVIRFGLSPLNKLTDLVERRDPENLNPILVDKLHKETAPMIRAVNLLMSKLSGTLARERRFLADAAHELRTPLAVIQAQAHLLETAENLAERSKAARQLELGVGRAASLIGKLLTMAQLSSDEFKPIFEELEVNSQIQERVAALSVLAIKKNIELSFHQTETLYAPISKASFVSAFDNVLDNAIRYTPEFGTVEVSVRRSEALEFTVSVLDSGPSIPHTKFEKVFERFYRVQGNEQEGSGLGLPIARRAMQTHQGAVIITSGPEGIGLLVELSAPLSRLSEQ